MVSILFVSGSIRQPCYCGNVTESGLCPLYLLTSLFTSIQIITLTSSRYQIGANQDASLLSPEKRIIDRPIVIRNYQMIIMVYNDKKNCTEDAPSDYLKKRIMQSCNSTT